MIQIENTITVVCFTLLITKLIRQFKDTRVLYAGFLLYTVGYSIISFSNSLWVIAAAILLATIGELMHVSVRQAYLAEIVKEDARSSCMAVNGLVYQGAKAFGAIGISVGVVLSSGMMATLYLLMGIAGLVLTRYVVTRAAREKANQLPKSNQLPKAIATLEG